METSPAIRMPSFLEEGEFIPQIHFLSFIVINCSDALDNFILVFFDQNLCSLVRMAIKSWVCYSIDVFAQIAPQKVCNSFDVFSLPQISHFLQVRPDAFEIVDITFIFVLPIVLSFFLV